MPDFTNQFLATFPAAQALLTLVQSGTQIAGHYSLRGKLPAGSYLPVTPEASIAGEFFADRQLPFENVSDFALRQAAPGTGLHACLTIGRQTFYALMLDVNNRSLHLRLEDSVAAIASSCPPDFANYDFDVRNEAQLDWRAASLSACLADATTEMRPRLETLRSDLERDRATIAGKRAAHLAINPHRPEPTCFAGTYSYGEEHSYTGNRMEATIELHESPGGVLTGQYSGPSASEPFVNWTLPMGSAPIAGELLANRAPWSFPDTNSLDSWKMNEHYFGLPGGPLEARIVFSGLTFHLLRTADGSLHLFDADDILSTGRGPWIPQDQRPTSMNRLE